MDYRKILPSFAACKHCIKLDEKTGEPRSLDGDQIVTTGGSFFTIALLCVVWQILRGASRQYIPFFAEALVGVLAALCCIWLVPSFFGVMTHHLFWMFDGEKLALHVHRRNPWKHELKSGLCQWLSWSYDGLPRTTPHIRGCILRIRDGAFFPRLLTGVNTVLWPDERHFSPEVCGVASLRRVLIRSRCGDSTKYFGYATAAEALAMLNEHRDVHSWLHSLERRTHERRILSAGLQYILQELGTHDRKKSNTGKWVIPRITALSKLRSLDIPAGTSWDELSGTTVKLLEEAVTKAADAQLASDVVRPIEEVTV